MAFVCLFIVLFNVKDTEITEPPLSPAEREVVKSFGGWTSFMQSYGLKPHDSGDAREAKLIVERMAKGN